MFRRLKDYYTNCSIKGKINISVIGAAGLILVLIMSIVLVRTNNIVATDAEKNAEQVCSENAAWTCNYVDEKIGSLRTVAYCFEGQAGMGDLKFDLYKNMIDRILKDDKDLYAIWYIEDFRISDTSLVQKYVSGNAVTGNKAELLSLIEKEAGYMQARQNGELTITNPFRIKDEWVVGITMPIKADGTITGATGFLIKTDLFSRIVAESMDSEDISCKIITNDGYIAAHPNKKNIGQKLDEEVHSDEIIGQIKKGEKYTGYGYTSTFDESSYKVFIPIDFSTTKSKWSFCTMVPKSAITRTTDMEALIILSLMLIGLALLAITTNAIAKMLSAPIVKTSQELDLISEGRLNETTKINIRSNDEIGVMVDGLNNLTDNLKHLASFAHEIGTGNLDADISAKGENDILGKSLVEMKQNLIAAKYAEEERKDEDAIRNWKVEGNARIHEVIRRENTCIKQLCDAVFREIITYSKAIQGGLFVVNDDQQEGRYVELVSCIAYSRQKMMTKRMELDEGIIGRCIYEKAPIILSEIPQDYLFITSGLGDRRPDFLVVVPMLNNEDVVGVIEVASFDCMPQHVLEYIEKAAESLASAIANVRINERTHKLLEQSRQYAEEMSAQEEEIRQNMEEMQASQEEVERKNQEYENIISQLRAELDRRG